MGQHGVPQELDPRGEIELSLDSLTVRLDRLDAQVQQLRDFSSAGPFADQVQNLQFAVGEPLDRVRRQMRGATGESGQHAVAHRVGHVEVPFEYAPQ